MVWGPMYKTCHVTTRDESNHFSKIFGGGAPLILPAIRGKTHLQGPCLWGSEALPSFGGPLSCGCSAGSVSAPALMASSYYS